MVPCLSTSANCSYYYVTCASAVYQKGQHLMEYGRKGEVMKDEKKHHGAVDEPSLEQFPIRI